MLLRFICALTHPPEAFTLWRMGSVNSLHNASCPVIPKPLGPTEILITIAGKSTKPSSVSSPVNSHARNKNANERGKKRIPAVWILGAFSSQHSPAAIQTNAGREVCDLVSFPRTGYCAIVRLPLNFSFITMTRGISSGRTLCG